jgi:hypothetical protein
MNIYQFYGKIGPWATPAPAAIALAGRLYGEWAGQNQLTAWAVALFSLVALEVVGGLCSYQAIQSTRTKQWGWFWVCLAGVLAYMGLGVYALWGVTAWIYIILAVFTHVAVSADLVTEQAQAEVRAAREDIVTDRQFALVEKELALKEEKERTAQARAAARAAASTAQTTPQAPAATPQKPQKIYPCDRCDAVFYSQQSYAAHRRHCKEG